MREALDLLRTLLNAQEPVAEAGAQPPPGPGRVADAPASASSGAARPADALEPAKPPTAEDQEASAAAHRQAVHSGKTAHVQVRMSTVDHSYAVDFYLRPEAEAYADRFRSGYAQIKARSEVAGEYTERQAPYRFAHCQNCDFPVLTARDEHERYLCQACGERGPVVTTTSPNLAKLARECEAAIGRTTHDEADEDSMVLAAFWDLDDDRAQSVAERMRNAGFSQADADCPAAAVFQSQMERRRPETAGPPQQIWHRPRDREGGLKGETPRSLDLLLRRMRRELGPLTSASMDLPVDVAKGMLANAEMRLRWLREEVEKDPGSAALKGALVVAELAAGNAERAAQIAAAMEVVAPDDPEAMLAASHVAFRQGRHDEAIQRLEKLLEMNERNTGARGLLIMVCKAAGNEEMASYHLRVFHALGGMPDLLGG